MKPNKKDIAKMIADLKKILPKVRSITAFGESNHAAIEAQIKVLSEDMSEDLIEGRYADTRYSRDSAMEARQWLDGEEIEFGLLEGWEGLILK